MRTPRNGMSYSDAGRLGAEKTKPKLAELKAANIKKYNLNPKLCKLCGKVIDYEHRRNDYCSQSCAASVNNAGRELSIEDRYKKSLANGGDGHRYICFNCGKLRTHLDDPFCSDKCRNEYISEHKNDANGKIGSRIAGVNASRTKWEEVKLSIKSTGEYPFTSSTNDTRRTVVRRYLEETVGHKCAICGISEWNGQPVPLVVDHIDGDSTNHSVENLRLLCYNCDAQTDTFKRRGNRVSTRRWREKYFKKTDS